MQSNMPDSRKSGATAEDNRPAIPGAAAGPDAEPEKPWWSTRSGVLNALAIVAIVAAGMVAIFAERPRPKLPPVADVPAQVATATATDASPTALPRVVLDGAAEVSFDQLYPATYTILGIDSGPGIPERFELRFHVRLHARSDQAVNFARENFALLIDGEPHTADSALTGSVAGNATGEATIAFAVPHGAHALALRIMHHDSRGGVVELPLRLVSDEVSEGGAAKTR